MRSASTSIENVERGLSETFRKPFSLIKSCPPGLKIYLHSDDIRGCEP
jgi:hypothetical protein